MLISITEKCRMGCSHCMDDARADSEKHMSMETFKKALEFNFKYDQSIIITGGEPTENPLFWDMMNELADYMHSSNFCVVMTNGMNLSNDDIPKIIALREKTKGTITWQVSSIRPYYPIHIDERLDIFKLSDFHICKKIEKLSPMGRAAQHQNWIFTSKAPGCFNFRSIVRSTLDLTKSVHLLRKGLYFCTPQISFDGKIKVGESTLCPAVASIYDDEKEIVKKIYSFTCNNKSCQEMLDKLPSKFKAAIGE